MTEEHEQEAAAVRESWDARVRRRSENPRWWVLYICVIVWCLVMGAVITVLRGNYVAGGVLEGMVIVWGIVLIPVGRRAGRRAETHRAERLTRMRTKDGE
jgi:hypothetical protein